MKPYMIHMSDCPCKHATRSAETQIFGRTEDECPDCLCLLLYGQCCWPKTWGDQYAGGTDYCSTDALPGSRYCASHGGALQSENALLKKRLAVAGRKLDILLPMIRSMHEDLYGTGAQKLQDLFDQWRSEAEITPAIAALIDEYDKNNCKMGPA